MLTCQECGYQTTPFEWECNKNLCEHLYLDALARKQKRLRPRLLVNSRVIVPVAA